MAQHSFTANWLALPASETVAGTRSLVATLHWILRIGAAGCFIGHGAFGILTLPPFNLVKQAWVNYFAVVGIDRATAVSLMPFVGVFDITMGVLMLVIPIRAAMAWLSFWGVWTALLRPLAGEGAWEFVERAGNFGVPFVLLYLSGFGTSLRSWFFEVARPALDERKAHTMEWMLRIIGATCLVGHGAFGAFVMKKVWFGYLGALGLSQESIRAQNLLGMVGWAEIALGFAVLVLPFRRVVALRYLLLALPVMKIGFEMLRFPTNEPYGWFEVIERTGTYTSFLALFAVLFWLDRARAGAADRVTASMHRSPDSSLLI